MHEVHTLQVIDKAEDNNMTHIARVCMVSKSTLTSNITNLEKKGYVVRFKDEKDKRINRVTLTDKAYDVLKKAEGGRLARQVYLSRFFNPRKG